MTEAAAPNLYPDAPIHSAQALPVQPPRHLFGRDRLLASSQRAIRSGTAILLYGLTGSGKSTVASVLAAAQTAASDNGVLWLTLTHDSLSTLLCRAARAYGLVNIAEASQSDQIATVQDLLAKHHPLIVLDGAIEPDAVRSFVREVASGLPLIVIDSQLKPGMWMPTPLPPLADDARYALLHAYGYQDSGSGSASISELVALIGGNALALELAARYLGAHIPDENQHSVDDLIMALYGTIDEAAEKDDAQAIDRLLAIIYPTLTPIAQGVLLVLGGVFTGAASAELMAALTQLTPPQLTQVMRTLKKAGLVHIGARYGQPYYTMHDAIQADMRRRLYESDALSRIEDRTLQALEAYVARHARPTPIDHDRLAAELPNVVAASAYAVSVSEPAPVRALIDDLEHAAGDFVTTRGFQPELRQMRDRLGLLDPARAFAPVATEAEPTVADAAASLPLPADSELQAATPEPIPAPVAPAPEPPPHMPEFESYLNSHATLSGAAPTAPEPTTPAPVIAASSTQPAAPVAIDTAPAGIPADRTTRQGLQACIDAARASNDQASLADCALRLGDLYMNVQDMTDAISNYRIAIEALQAGSDQYLTALALERLGHAELIDGEPGDAAHSLEGAVELLGADTKTADRARVLTALSSTYELLQDWPAAQQSHERGAEDSQRIGDSAQEAIHWGGAARAYQAQGRPLDAINSYRKGLHIAYTRNDNDLIAGYSAQLGSLLLTDGKSLNQAVSLLSESISRHPDNIDTSRLLKRGQRWIDQARSNQVVLPAALDNPQYARLAYTEPVAQPIA